MKHPGASLKHPKYIPNISKMLKKNHFLKLQKDIYHECQKAFQKCFKNCWHSLQGSFLRGGWIGSMSSSNRVKPDLRLRLS